MNAYRIYGWLFSVIFVVLLAAVILGLATCAVDSKMEGTKKEAASTIDATQIIDVSIADYPAQFQIVRREGMTYMIVSTSSLQGGVAVRNLTLDSVQIAYYKMMLGY